MQRGRDDVLAAIESDCPTLAWVPNRAGGFSTRWRGRPLNVFDTPPLVTVDGVEVARGERARPISDRITELFWTGVLDGGVRVSGRRLYLGDSWCCAVRVSEILFGKSGLIADYFRDVPDDEREIPSDFAVMGGRMYVGRSACGAPLAGVYSALLAAFLDGESTDEISVPWDVLAGVN